MTFPLTLTSLFCYLSLKIYCWRYFHWNSKIMYFLEQFKYAILYSTNYKIINKAVEFYLQYEHICTATFNQEHPPLFNHRSVDDLQGLQRAFYMAKFTWLFARIPPEYFITYIEYLNRVSLMWVIFRLVNFYDLWSLLLSFENKSRGVVLIW